MKKFAECALLCLVVAASYAKAEGLLGLPFGDKLELRACPANSDKAKAPCWIDKPFFYKPTGAKLGYIHVPNPDSRPSWAAYAMFQITLDGDSKVQELRVEPVSREAHDEILSSVSIRFGAPKQSDRFDNGLSSASWRSSEGTANMYCSPGKCFVEFRTPKAQAEREAGMAAQRLKNAARPKAP